jgi:hypothetical protein
MISDNTIDLAEKSIVCEERLDNIHRIFWLFYLELFLMDETRMDENVIKIFADIQQNEVVLERRFIVPLPRHEESKERLDNEGDAYRRRRNMFNYSA